jgi:hypothetical protein
MASTYVNDLRLNEMATGDASGSWGTVTNTNLELIGEAFSYGTETIGDADSTLTIADGAADAARSFYLKITSSVDLTTTRIVTLGPNTVSKVWMIENATTGSQVITIKQGSGATINVPNGQVKMISTDGAGSGGAVLDLLVDVDLTGTTTLVNLDVSGTLGVTGVLTTTAATVSNGGGQFNGAINVGVDDTGYDVKFFGATTGKSLLWDESADSLIVTGTTTLVGTTNLDAVDIDGATQIDATVTVGVDDTGYDVKFFGATAGAYMLWDESADDLILGGAAGLSVNSTALVTGVLTTTAATVFNGGFAAGGVGTFADGSNSAPSLTNTGDLNTGLYFPAADEVGLTVGGTQRLNVSATGIDVTGTVVADGLTVAGTVSFTGGGVQFPTQLSNSFTPNAERTDLLFASNPTSNNALRIGSIASNAGVTLQGTRYNDSALKVDLVLQPDGGNVGIGTSSPISKFVVSDNGGYGFEFIPNNSSINQILSYDRTASAYRDYKVSANQIIFGYGQSGSNEAMRIDASGSIDIANTGGTLYTTTAGTSNLRLGVNAGNSIASGGNYNVFIGDEAGTAITTGDYNTAVGYKALFSDTLGNRSVAIGREALLNQNFTSDTDAYNIAVGYGAGLNNATGIQNTNLGGFSGYYGTTADGSTFVGYAAGFGNDGSPLTGNNNTAVGYQAGGLLQGGASENVLVGAYAGDAITTGSENVCVGLGAGGGITTGTRNTCIGDDAGNAITTATRSIAIGHLAMGVTAVTGTGNVAIGYQTGYAMLAGAENVMIGEYAGAAITSGSRNTCVGINSGNATTTAVDNVFLGTQAGTYEVGTTTGSYNTIVGGYCHTSAVDSIQQIVMGHNVTGNGDNTLCFGNATTDSSIAFGATSITAPSDQRYKEEIADATAGLSFIKDLRPVTFKWKKEKDVPSDHPAYVEGSDKRVMESNGETNHGFIAQEVKAVIDNHPEIKDGFAMWSEQGLDENGNSTGGRQRLGDGALIPILVKAIQELEARLAVLEG